MPDSLSHANEAPVSHKKRLRRKKLICPESDCRSPDFYMLADGRRACKVCHKKYTPCPKKFRISNKHLSNIVEEFYRMTSPSSAATALGLHPNTAKGYYCLFRHLIFSRAEEQLGGLRKGVEAIEKSQQLILKDKSLKIPIFCLMIIEEQVRVVFFKQDQKPIRGNPHITNQPIAWVYASSSGKALNIRSYQQDMLIPLEHDSHCALNFWDCSKSWLMKYRGQYMRNFPLFMREMEFRFNYQEKSDFMRQLLRIMRKLPCPV
ncbi:hypothetical protein [Geotalea sp. SG265]|uniref:hypothetical protein n=1 Tax=Geotalea sp. SG265 TaxID=2922867 RepID=UPI001FAEBEC8|nr:hypothetical protein [Geotalea sp. SG265]